MIIHDLSLFHTIEYKKRIYMRNIQTTPFYFGNVTINYDNRTSFTFFIKFEHRYKYCNKSAGNAVI